MTATTGAPSTSAPSIAERFERYLIDAHREELVRILTANDPRAPYVIHVDALRLCSIIPVLGNAMLHRPLALLPAMDDAVRSAQGAIYGETRRAFEAGDASAGETLKTMSVKEIVRARPDVHRLCETYPELSPEIGGIRSNARE
jgi:hypothetical protein